MLIGIISDIHSNLPALEAVLASLDDLAAERIYCLGDTVGYGPFPVGCLNLVRQRCAVVLQGNHDSGVIGETSIHDFNIFGLKAVLWTREVLSDDEMAYLRSCPLTWHDNSIMLAHASPKQPFSWNYLHSITSAIDAFDAFHQNDCFVGHTHLPLIVGEDGSVNRVPRGVRRIINVGSVGQPRDGNPAAAFGTYDTATREFKLRRVSYDIDRTAEAIREEGLPEFLARRLYQGV
jgi:diadenosine tetraphosphatase ApaH/serine/threonine PP2A family protein phosphatase